MQFDFHKHTPRKLEQNRNLLLDLGLGTLLGLIFGATLVIQAKEYETEIVSLKEEIGVGLDMAAEKADYAYKLEDELAKCKAKLPEEKVSEKKVSTGKVSFYSQAGCIGCSSDLRTASGDILDDSKNTLALPLSMRGKIKLGTMVKVTNLDNGLSTMAKFNDYGGFEKYNRIGDLSLATCEAIECKTDVSNIEIEWE